MHHRLKDTLLVGVIVLTLVGWIKPLAPYLHPRHLYVAPHGSDWYWGASPQRPLKTIRRATALARPGTVITILPGHFNERLVLRRRGLENAPIVLRAVQPGTVVISGQAPDHITPELFWEFKGKGVYSTNAPWPLYAFCADGERLLHCRTVKAFHQFTTRAHAYGAFVQSGKRVLVRLRDGLNPEKAALKFNGPVPNQLANGVWRAANVWVEASHVRFEGIRFELGGGSGISLFGSRDVDIRECLFIGADTDVDASCAAPGRINLNVQHCASLNYPASEWQPRWLSWQDCYTHQRHRSFIAVSRDGVSIQGNLIIGASDGMHVSTPHEPCAHGAVIRGNLIAHCNDDAVEFDGFAENIRFHHNLVYDCPTSLGVSPVLRGPVTIAHNLFLHPADLAYACQIKFLNPWWNKSPPLNGPIRNIEIYANTFVSDWLCWHHPQIPVVDVWVHHNRFAIQRCGDPPWPSGVNQYANDYIDLPLDGYPNPGMDARWLAVIKSPSIDRCFDENGCDESIDQYQSVRAGPKWRIKRPGPTWLDWRAEPAARRLLTELDPGLFQ